MIGEDDDGRYWVVSTNRGRTKLGGPFETYDKANREQQKLGHPAGGLVRVSGRREQVAEPKTRRAFTLSWDMAEDMPPMDVSYEPGNFEMPKIPPLWRPDEAPSQPLEEHVPGHAPELQRLLDKDRASDHIDWAKLLPSIIPRDPTRLQVEATPEAGTGHPDIRAFLDGVEVPVVLASDGPITGQSAEVDVSDDGRSASIVHRGGASVRLPPQSMPKPIGRPVAGSTGYTVPLERGAFGLTVLTLKARDAIAAIKAADYTAEQLRALVEAETAGKARKTVLRALGATL